MDSVGAILARILAGSWRASPPPLEVSAEELGQVAPLLAESGAGALGWWTVRTSHLRETASAEWLHDVYKLEALQNAVRERKILDVLAVVRSAGVEPIVIKGWSVARLYADPLLRPYGDVDLLLPPGDVPRANTALHDAGESADTWHEEFDVLDERGWTALFSRSQVVMLGTTAVRVLSPEDQLPLLSVHFLRHGAWRPLWLCDICAALEARPSDFDWDTCLGAIPWPPDWVGVAVGLGAQLWGVNVANTPLTWRAGHMPGWLEPEVLKQWDRPAPRFRTPPEIFGASLRRPVALRGALAARWSNPIQATIRMRGSFDARTRLPYQVADFLGHTVRYGSERLRRS